MRFQSRPINWPLLTIESPVAQWLEHPTRSRRVVGSNPIWGSDFFRVLQNLIYQKYIWTENYYLNSSRKKPSLFSLLWSQPPASHLLRQIISPLPKYLQGKMPLSSNIAHRWGNHISCWRAMVHEINYLQEVADLMIPIIFRRINQISQMRCPKIQLGHLHIVVTVNFKINKKR